jgi:hypothetical protein
MTDDKDKEVKEIVNKAIERNWRKIIELQTNPYREYHHAEVLKNVLHILTANVNIFSKDLIAGETCYLVSLIRYFGKKSLNNGYYFRKEEDAENFVKQYREIMASNSFLEREDGEEIEIVGIKLLSKEKTQN